MNSFTKAAAKAAPFLLAGVLLVGQAQAEESSRKGYQFKTLRSGYGLSQAQMMYQAERDLLGQRVTNNVTNNVSNTQTTAAESITTITTDCGNNTLCQIDALFNRAGKSSQTAGSTTTTTHINE